eukprot:7312291-Prymnesium_polylepis.3
MPVARTDHLLSSAARRTMCDLLRLYHSAQLIRLYHRIPAYPISTPGHGGRGGDGPGSGEGSVMA